MGGLIGDEYINRITYLVSNKNDTLGYLLIKNKSQYSSRFIRITGRCTANIDNVFVAHVILSSSPEILSKSQNSNIDLLPLNNYGVYLKLNVNNTLARSFLFIIEILDGVISDLSVEYQSNEPI